MQAACTAFCLTRGSPSRHQYEKERLFLQSRGNPASGANGPANDDASSSSSSNSNRTDGPPTPRDSANRNMASKDAKKKLHAVKVKYDPKKVFTAVENGFTGAHRVSVTAPIDSPKRWSIVGDRYA